MQNDNNVYKHSNDDEILSHLSHTEIPFALRDIPNISFANPPFERHSPNPMFSINNFSVEGRHPTLHLTLFHLNSFQQTHVMGYIERRRTNS